jgi:hypothetical protein
MSGKNLQEKIGSGGYTAQLLNCGSPLSAFPIETELTESEVKL